MTGLVAALLLVPAQSSSAYETILQDDGAVMGGSDEQVRDAMTEMKQLGVDRVRITVPWRDVSPQGRSGTRPARFDASDPAAYQRSWDEYFAGSLPRVDRAVYAAHAAGLKVMLDLAFGAPLWATTSRTGSTVFDGASRPSPTEFAAFAKAMARRYSGNFSLPWAPLPAVDVFELWNEPNVPYFLRPQFESGRPVSPDWYRDVVAAAYPAIKSVRSQDTVLIGSTAADGTARAVAPLAFLRRLACVDARLRPIRDGACKSFRRVPGDGFSHHPYALNTPPTDGAANPDNVRMANLDRLTSLTRRLIAKRRLAPGVANLWLTEFGYETNVPVRTNPWSPAQQVQLLAEAEFIAQRNPYVRSISQFLLHDVDTRAALRASQHGRRDHPPGSWQTGLYYEEGKPKPSAASFRLTLLPVIPSGARKRQLLFWGHVRPARGAARVRIERTRADGTWIPVTTWPAGGGPAAARFSSDRRGILWRSAGAASATGPFRLCWQAADGGWQAGPAVMPLRLPARFAGVATASRARRSRR